MGRVCGLLPPFCLGMSRDSDTMVPVFTRAAACLRFAEVIRFRAPSSSSLPQRPQLESSVIHRANCSFVTLLRFAGWSDGGWPYAIQAPHRSATETIVTTACIRFMTIRLLHGD